MIMNAIYVGGNEYRVDSLVLYQSRNESMISMIQMSHKWLR